MQGAEYVALSLLGPFGLTAGDAPPRAIRISSRKGRAVLAYLAMQRDRSESRDRLATLLWGDRFDKDARHSLRQCLVRLRADLGPVASGLLVLDSEVVRLRSERVTIDAVAFEAFAKSSDLADLQRAAALYRGEFLAGFAPESEPFDDWMQAERARLQATAARVFEGCGERLEAIGSGAQAIEAIERLVALDPLREDLQRRLLALYARHRGRDAALAHAKTVVALLARELDVEPEPATRTLVEEIRREPSAAPAFVTGADAPAAVAGALSLPGQIVQPAASGRHPARLVRPAAALVSVAAIGLVGLALLLVGRDQPVPATQPTPAPASDPGQAARDWTPPRMPAGPEPEKAAFAARGFTPVIVLPFRIYGDNESDKLLAEQVTDDLISDLSRAPSLRVISGQTSRLYRGSSVDVAAIGRELGVRYAIEGGVRTQGDLLRINVDLVDATTRMQAWSERFERERSDRFAIQNEIVRGLARRLQVEVMGAEARRPADRPQEPEIIKLAAMGWTAMWRSPAAATTGEAKAIFEQILASNPDSSHGLMGLAAHHVVSAGDLYDSEREAHLVRAQELLARAIDRYPRSPIANYYLGVLHKHRGRSQEALASFARALELYPSHAASYAQMGSVLARLGRGDEAIEHIRYALRLSPRDPGLPAWMRFAGQAEIERGNDAAAIEWLKQSVTHGPTQPWSHAALAAAYALAGETERAAQQVAEIRRFAPWALDRIKLDVDQRLARKARPTRFWLGVERALAAASL